MTEGNKNLHQRLAAVMAEVDYIQKEHKKGMNYTIVSHDAVTAKVRPVLLKNGVVYYPVRCEHTHSGNRAECSLTVRFANIDEPSDFIDVPTFGYGIDPQDKGPGKAMSYAVKYALLKALGLETGDDPDTDHIDFSPKDAHASAPKAAAPSQPPVDEAAKPSAASMKRGLEEIERELLDCHSTVAVETCAATWRHILKRDGWTKDYIAAAGDKFNARKAVLAQSQAEDVFPGDLTNSHQRPLEMQ